MGIGDWGLGAGDWGVGVVGLGPTPKPKTPAHTATDHNIYPKIQNPQ